MLDVRGWSVVSQVTHRILPVDNFGSRLNLHFSPASASSGGEWGPALSWGDAELVYIENSGQCGTSLKSDIRTTSAREETFPPTNLIKQIDFWAAWSVSRTEKLQLIDPVTVGLRKTVIWDCVSDRRHNYRELVSVPRHCLTIEITIRILPLLFMR